jgi:methionyl-tRNA formyltransferase
MATSEFSVAPYKSFAQDKDKYSIEAVITQPDRPAGRGLNLKFSPIKQVAVQENRLIFQPEKIRSTESIEFVKKIEPDLIIVVAYGQIIPNAILNIPKIACLNIHASLLPEFRGPAPIHYAILQGKKETGISIIYMNDQLDAGDILIAEKCPIDSQETFGALQNRLSLLSVNLIHQAIDLLLQGRAPRRRQDHSKMSYAPMLGKAELSIDWNQTALDIFNKIRGLYPWPVARCWLSSQEVKVIQARLQNTTENPGTITHIGKEGIEVAAVQGSILLQQIQPASRRVMAAYEYFLGARPPMKEGDILDSKR